MRLTAEESAMLAGDHGEAVAFAMRVVTATARVQAAPHLLEISAAHIDSCLYHGPSSLDYVRRLVDGGGTVRVPTTLNVGGLDLMRPEIFQGTAAESAPRRELMEHYVELGAAPTFTCAPYQLPGRPEQGADVAWAESNAIVFGNSVLGARTNRYGDLIDIAAAITGRVPYAGLHIVANRAAQIVFEVDPDVVERTDVDLLPSLLGHHVGRRTGSLIPVVTGIPPESFSEDWGKAFGAAAASSGGLALFHIAGSTPEAPDLTTALQGNGPQARRRITLADVDESRQALSTVDDSADLAGISLGTPHMSRTQIRSVADHLDGRAVAVPTYVSTSRHVTESEPQAVQVLESAGVTIVRDTCTYITPIMTIDGVVMTNSAKWAHYAPANLGLDVVLASQSDCLDSALAGTIVRRSIA